jgi:hypothetical protein
VRGPAAATNPIETRRLSAGGRARRPAKGWSARQKATRPSRKRRTTTARLLARTAGGVRHLWELGFLLRCSPLRIGMKRAKNRPIFKALYISRTHERMVSQNLHSQTSLHEKRNNCQQFNHGTNIPISLLCRTVGHGETICSERPQQLM